MPDQEAKKTGALHAVARGDGRLDILCEHSAAYEALGVEEDGIVSMASTCGHDECGDLTLVGTSIGVGVKRDA